MVCSMWEITRMTEIAYQALPMPKLDESQTEYKTIMNNGFDVWCIPKNAPDKEASGIILEAFASANYRKVSPRFYEDNLKMRYTDTAQGARVYDLIRDSVIYDFGRISQDVIGVTEGLFRNCLWDGSLKIPSFNNNFISMLDSKEATFASNLAKLLKTYRNDLD